MYSTTHSLSMTGFVLGIQHTVVNPPLAAAFAPLSISSLCSRPGARKCTCKSISPGTTHLPLASIHSSYTSSNCPIWLTFPSSIQRSVTVSICVFGLITNPFLIQSFISLLSFLRVKLKSPYVLLPHWLLVHLLLKYYDYPSALA